MRNVSKVFLNDFLSAVNCLAATVLTIAISSEAAVGGSDIADFRLHSNYIVCPDTFFAAE